MTQPRSIALLVLASALALFQSHAVAQSGGPYEIISYTIDSGGITQATGGVYQMGGTIGQPDASAELTGGAYTLSGGFWPTVRGPSCAADFSGDGILDIFDVFEFIDAYNNLDPAADFAMDGIFDIFDVFEFLNAFNAGCV